MPSALRDAVEERLTLRNLLLWAVTVGGLHYLLGAPVSQLAMTAVLGGAYGLADVARDAYDVRESVTHVLTGAIGFVGGAAMLAIGDGVQAIAVAFALIGAWFVLDAVQTARHRGVTEEEPDGRDVYEDYLARRVHELVQERPRTTRELYEEFDADTADVDAATDRLRDRDVIEKAGSEYRIPDSETGRFGAVGEWVGTLASRVARPLALEFEADGREREPGVSGSSTAPDPSDAAREPSTSADDETRPTEADERDREPETAG